MLSEGEFSFADLQKDAHARGGSSKASYESPVKSTGDPHGNKREVQQNKENALSSYNNKSNNVAVINSATIDEYKLSAMLGTECKITLMPAHCWKNNKGGKYEYQSDESSERTQFFELERTKNKIQVGTTCIEHGKDDD